jgi:hypothetical protein
MSTNASPSKKSIDRAGIALREWWADADADDDDLTAELLVAAQLVLDFRSGFRYPLQKVTVGVRQFVRSESAEIVVSSRLKRLPTILDKLERHPNMKVTRMQDIGGCRAVLPGLSEVFGVLTRIERNWDVVELYNYVENPKPVTGYRAVHAVVRRDSSLLEVQLRTASQQGWALEIERTGSRLDFPRLKDGEGPRELVRYFELAAYFLGLRDSGMPSDQPLLEGDAVLAQEFRDLAEEVAPFFARPGERE